MNRLVGWNATSIGRSDSSLSSCTIEVQATIVHHAPSCYAKVNEFLDGRRMILLDCPGLDPVSMNFDMEASALSVVQWLEATCAKF